MAQRSLEISTISSPAAQSAILTDVDRRALERIHYEAGDWDRLNWFVRLVNAKLEKASEGDILPLQEEWIALQRACFRERKPPTPTREQIARLQARVRTHLENLIEKGKTRFDGYDAPTLVMYPQVATSFPNPRSWTTGRRTLPDRITWNTPPPGDMSLMHLFKDLVALGTQPGIILRCPYCRTIFLQSRRNQYFCSRTCQSRAITEKGREEAKKEATKTLQSGRIASRKRGTHHGKK